jgi:hypothetical protein
MKRQTVSDWPWGPRLPDVEVLSYNAELKERICRRTASARFGSLLKIGASRSRHREAAGVHRTLPQTRTLEGAERLVIGGGFSGNPQNSAAPRKFCSAPLQALNSCSRTVPIV